VVGRGEGSRDPKRPAPKLASEGEPLEATRWVGGWGSGLMVPPGKEKGKKETPKEDKRYVYLTDNNFPPEMQIPIVERNEGSWILHEEGKIMGEAGKASFI